MRDSLQEVVENVVRRVAGTSIPVCFDREQHRNTGQKQLEKTIEKISTSFSLSSRCELDHYGCGYASYVEAWFYRSDGLFRLSSNLENDYTGLCVLLCRLAPVYCMFEGEKSWHRKGGASFLPDFDSVDEFETQVVKDLSIKVEPFLLEHGYFRIRRSEMSGRLRDDVKVPTILGGEFLREYDAIFHWED